MGYISRVSRANANRSLTACLAPLDRFCAWRRAWTCPSVSSDVPRALCDHKAPGEIKPVNLLLETPARSDVTLAMDRMLDHVARDTKRPKLAEPEDDKGPTVADLAAYLVSRGGNAAQADGWSVGKNPRGDTIYTDSSSGRVFRSKPEVVRFLNVGQA